MAVPSYKVCLMGHNNNTYVNIWTKSVGENSLSNISMHNISHSISLKADFKQSEWIKLLFCTL